MSQESLPISLVLNTTTVQHSSHYFSYYSPEIRAVLWSLTLYSHWENKMTNIYQATRIAQLNIKNDHVY